MTLRRTRGVGMVLMVGIVRGALGGHGLNAQQAEKRTPLVKAEMAGIQGQDGSVTLVEMAPGAVGEKHYHNGDVFLYILEGAQTLELEGQPPVSLRAGQSYHIAPKVAITPKNPSSSAPVKFIAFAVVPKGQPVSTSVK